MSHFEISPVFPDPKRSFDAFRIFEMVCAATRSPPTRTWSSAILLRPEDDVNSRVGDDGLADLADTECESSILERFLRNDKLHTA